MKVAPFRKLDEFCGKEARFELPKFNEPERIENRIRDNLLYYQTNYFVLFAIIFVIVMILNPLPCVMGFLVLALGFAGAGYISKNPGIFQDMKTRHPYVCVVVILVAAYFCVSMIGILSVFLMGTALPLFLIFVHAMLRLRNTKNKITKLTTKVDEIAGTVEPATPMEFIIRLIDDSASFVPSFE